MDNPYVERVVARMQADDAYKLLQSHWSSRAWWAIQRIATCLQRFGLERASNAFLVATEPVSDWLAHRQAVFLRRWL